MENINELKEVQFFNTPDLPLVACLVTLGYQISTIDRNNPNKVIFYIKRDESLDTIVQKYLSFQLLIEPCTYANAIKLLKRRIFNK